MSKKVLVAEDNRVIRTAQKHWLRRGGFEVIQAEDGEETLRLAREDRPDIIVLDLLMPKLGGVEVLSTLKADSQTARIPVIVVTALSQRNERKLADIGAAAYFEKAVTGPEHLPALVKKVLRDSRVM